MRVSLMVKPGVANQNVAGLIPVAAPNLKF